MEVKILALFSHFLAVLCSQWVILTKKSFVSISGRISGKSVSNKWFPVILQTIIPNLNGSQRDIPVNGFLTLPMNCNVLGRNSRNNHILRNINNV